MNSILFWKLWPKPYQILFWFLSTSFLVALILFWRGYLSWPAPAITYEHFQQLQTIEVPSHSFSIGLINVTVPADSYLIFENIFALFHSALSAVFEKTIFAVFGACTRVLAHGHYLFLCVFAPLR